MPMPAPSVFDGMPIASLQALLVEAQCAYARLMMGKTAREVVTQGDVVKYEATSAEQMQALIAQLQAAIAGRPTAGAIGVLWAD